MDRSERFDDEEGIECEAESNWDASSTQNSKEGEDHSQNTAFSRAKQSSHFDSDTSVYSDSGNDEAAVKVMKRLSNKAKRIGKHGKGKARKFVHVNSKREVAGENSSIVATT